ncbi:MAG: hypothetical protein WBA68_10175, partial [Alteraurantiacibacter sp.]
MIPAWQARAAAKFPLSGLAMGLAAFAYLALVAAFTVQTVRIEGFKVWPFEVRGWKGRAMEAEQANRDLKRDVELEQAEAARRLAA